MRGYAGANGLSHILDTLTAAGVSWVLTVVHAKASVRQDSAVHDEPPATAKGFMAQEARDEPLGERAQHLLRVLVESYIRDGQPVGSRALSRESGLQLSPRPPSATSMADLEELGFVSSPHTSAGRVPTDKGYRFFVDSLLKARPLDRGRSGVAELRRQLEAGARRLQGAGRRRLAAALERHAAWPVS